MHLNAIELELNRLAEKPLSVGAPAASVKQRAELLLRLADSVLAQWVIARGGEPTEDKREGFRLLALHRQGVKGEPSFNACRETCREVAYHFNLLTTTDLETDLVNGKDPRAQLLMMTMLVRHLAFFVSGKLTESGLGEFCCSSRPIRSGEVAADADGRAQ